MDDDKKFKLLMFFYKVVSLETTFLSQILYLKSSLSFAFAFMKKRYILNRSQWKPLLWWLTTSIRDRIDHYLGNPSSNLRAALLHHNNPSFSMMLPWLEPMTLNSNINYWIESWSFHLKTNLVDEGRLNLWWHLT